MLQVIRSKASLIMILALVVGTISITSAKSAHAAACAWKNLASSSNNNYYVFESPDGDDQYTITVYLQGQYDAYGNYCGYMRTYAFAQGQFCIYNYTNCSYGSFYVTIYKDLYTSSQGTVSYPASQGYTTLTSNGAAVATSCASADASVYGPQGTTGPENSGTSTNHAYAATGQVCG